MTRKLLLASGVTVNGFANEAVRAALADLLGKPLRETHALFVPTAVLGFPDGDKHAQYMSDQTAKVGWKSITTLELSTLPHLSIDEWLRQVNGIDALIVFGGNEFYLSYWMEQSGLFDALPALLDAGKVYVGESASSMVVTPAFNYDHDRLEKTGYFQDDEYDEGQPQATGSARTLGLVDFVIRPHLNADIFPQTTLENMAQWAAKSGYPCYVMDDNSALKIVDGRVEVVSTGVWKYFA